ncbi:MAG TPA: YggS family pyridoxal phosphate-dependent enzyme, partial [Thermoanaerobaculia bacterium]|nr:YggS family pyridoxal phosphate-dependent enzyme [Thermoanaerobaculia bacterium]
RERMAAAAVRAGRDPRAVTLVAVGKTKPLEDLLAAHAAGAVHFGENRVQEDEAKFPLLPAGAVRHLIGPIQSNKAARAARVADVVQTVDSAEIAGRLARGAGAAGKRLRVLIEVRLGGEATKAGVEPDDVPALADAVRALPGLELAGLMTIPPPGETRPHFAALRRLGERLGLPELSMGMSDDFEAAIEEGATLVRVGTAIFGTR